MPHTFAHHVSGGKWIPYYYLVFISHVIAGAIARGGGRILISVPPRHGKSFFLSQWLPAWFLAMWPEKSVMLATYEANFAAKWGRLSRAALMKYDASLVSKATTAASMWETTEGGGMVTAGVGGPITGKGFHLGLIDDPHKNWQEATSPVLCKMIQEWYDSTFYTRCEPGATIVVLHTRWTEDDLIGWILREKKDDGYIEIRLPAIAEEDDILDRPVGKALCPERFTEQDLLRTMRSIGSTMFAGLYQQRPAPAEGFIFKRANWRDFDPRREQFAYVIQSWDTAEKTTTGAAKTACQTWGVGLSGYCLLNRWADKVEYPVLERECIRQYEIWNPNLVLIEDKSSGTALLQNLKINKPLMPVLAVTPEADKYTRAISIQGIHEAGRLLLPANAPWKQEFIDTCAVFPNGKYKDEVDAMSQAIRYLSSNAAIGEMVTTMRRKSLTVLNGYR